MVHPMSRHVEGPWYWTSRDQWYATVGEKQIRLGVRGRQNRSKAVEAWHRLMSGTTTPEITSTNTAPEPTIKEVIEAFQADTKTRLKAATVGMYALYLDRFKVAFGGKRVSGLKAGEIHQWVIKQGKSSTTHKLALQPLSTCFEWAVKCELIEKNPCRRVPKPRAKSRSAEAVISEDEHQRLLAAAEEGFGQVLQVMWGTGCRPSEAAGITAETFDPVNNVVVLHSHKTDRTGRVRIIFLSPDVCDMLREQLAKFKTGGLLRSMKGLVWNSRRITEAFRRLQKKTGLRKTAYGYRHSFATAALACGIPDAQVAALLGHTTTAMVHAHYGHLTSQSQVLRDALGKVRG